MRLKKTSKLYLAKLMMILVLLSGFCIDTIAQTIISGKVTNQKDNSGIEGISIVIKGTRNGVVSDNLGGFSLKLNSNNAITLVASGVGFKAQELNVDPSKMATGLNIVLTEQYSKLDEVVVTGTAAGTTKRQLGSYVSSVSAEDLNKGASDRKSVV